MTIENSLYDSTLSSYAELQAHMKSIRVKDIDRSMAHRVVTLYSAISVCIDVLRGLNGEEYYSTECNMKVSEMIKKIDAYTKQKKIDDTHESQVTRYISLYDHLYCKIYNILLLCKN